MIRLTKENLEALNDEFGKHQHPPSMYLQVGTLKEGNKNVDSYISLYIDVTFFGGAVYIVSCV